MSVLIPEERILLRRGLPALGQLAAFLFIVGCCYVVDAFVRALFGTVEGAVGWIPFAGRVVKHSLHKIEQKITHALGSAEQTFDRRIGVCLHTLAHIVRQIPRDLLNTAELLLGIAGLLLYVPTKALVHKFIAAATKPLRAGIATVRRLEHGTAARLAALRAMVAHAVLPRIRAAEAAIGHVIEWDIPRLRARDLALGRELSRLWKWVRHRPVALTTGAFIGAFVWALGRLGIGYIRCSNWKRLGRTVCGMSRSQMNALLGLLAGVLVLANIREVAEFAEAVTEELGRDIARLVGAGDFPGERFTIE